MEEDTDSISIVILNFNSGNLLTDCVDSILKSTYKNFEIIVVDNDSKDHSQEKCKNKFAQIKLIQNKENFGYCEGNNIGIRQAKGEFIVILNPDTTVDANWLIELLKGFKKFGEGLYQPKLLTMNNHKIIGSAGNMINIFGFGYSRGRGEEDNGQYDKEEQISYASGTCLFTSRKILEKIGLLDSFLFAYHDDLELGWRGIELGIKSYYVPKSIVYHAESFNFKWSPFKFYLLEKNRKYCLQIHYSKTTHQKIRLELFLIDMAVWIFYISKGMLGAKIKAHNTIFKNRKYIHQKYCEIQENKTIQDAQIIEFFHDLIEIPKKMSNVGDNNMFQKFISKMSKNARKKIVKISK